MSNFFVTGKLGSGKTLYAVQKIREYLRSGRRVATNLDINLDEMFDRENESTLIRIPDKPRLEDMELIGAGHTEYVEEKFGLIVLDECATWLNSRNWNDKERFQLINWFLHARKKRWDIIFLVQDVSTLDKQLLGSLLEYHVTCKQLNKVPVPLLGHFGLKFPKVSIASMTYGTGSSAIKAGTETYKAQDLFTSYDTMQVFTDGQDFINEKPVDMRASYTTLSSSYLHRLKPLPEKEPTLFQLLFVKKKKPLKVITAPVLDLLITLQQAPSLEDGRVWDR